jgi:sugar phosphate isomerase/epimerase
MLLQFHKSLWEAECSSEQDLQTLLNKIAEEAYQGSELFLPFFAINSAQTVKLHKEFGLQIITGIATQGRTAKDHIISMNTQVDRALEYAPVLINSHTGRDILSFSDNLLVFENALSLEREHGITIVHETHRSRPTFSTLSTENLLLALPELKLNLDISHWMVVHESDLQDQLERINLILPHVHHIHARVGFEEGPQISDPQDPRWQCHLQNHTSFWQQVVDLACARGQQSLTITPEFGPFPYAQIPPLDQAPQTDIWAANNFMQNYLRKNLKPSN